MRHEQLALNSFLSTLSLVLTADGTPAGYYYAKGSDPSLWLVYLEVTIRDLRSLGCPCAQSYSTPPV